MGTAEVRLRQEDDDRDALQVLRAHRSSCDLPWNVAWDPVHHTPSRGEAMPHALIAWLASRGAVGMLADIPWRCDHPGLSARALEQRGRGDRVGASWETLEAHPSLGRSRRAAALEAHLFCLGLDLHVTAEGVSLGLGRRRDPSHWSTGQPSTAAAFRDGLPVLGGVHDPLLFGDAMNPAFGHMSMPWRVLPAHLVGWVSELLDRSESDVRAEIRERGVEGLVAPLDDALERRTPRACSLSGEPLVAEDFLWSDIPLLAVAYRRVTLRDGRAMPHGLDGPLYHLVGVVRRARKFDNLDGEALVEVRESVAQAVDAYLGGNVNPAAAPWGWSVAEELQSLLALDGVVMDWAGRALVDVVADRASVGLPRALTVMLSLRPDQPEAMLFARLPDQAMVASPETVDGARILLPTSVARTLRVDTGDVLRVFSAVSRRAQRDLDVLAQGGKLAPLELEPGWLDAVSTIDPSKIARRLADLGRAHATDAAIGPVGLRLFAGQVPNAAE